MELREIVPVWPSAAQEADMLRAADLADDMAGEYSVAADVNCHVKALLCRVRALELALRRQRGAVSLLREIVSATSTGEVMPSIDKAVSMLAEIDRERIGG